MTGRGRTELMANSPVRMVVEAMTEGESELAEPGRRAGADARERRLGTLRDQEGRALHEIASLFKVSTRTVRRA